MKVTTKGMKYKHEEWYSSSSEKDFHFISRAWNKLSNKSRVQFHDIRDWNYYPSSTREEGIKLARSSAKFPPEGYPRYRAPRHQFLQTWDVRRRVNYRNRESNIIEITVDFKLAEGPRRCLQFRSNCLFHGLAAAARLLALTLAFVAFGRAMN